MKADFIVPLISEKCSIFACPDAAYIAFACVKDELGKTTIDVASRFVTEQRKMKKGYEWQYWIVRCADCYQNDLYRSGKGHWSKCDEVKHLHADITLPEHRIDPKRRTPEQELRLKFIAETEMRKIAKIVGLPEPDFKHASPSQMLKQTIEHLI